VQRDFERDDPRRRYRPDDDPRDDPRERYGNEEDQYSREYRRTYAEQELPRRMHDDRPYNRPGYEPEVGRPGGRENVDLDGGDPYREYRERYARDQSRAQQQRSDPRSAPNRGRPEPSGRGGEPWQGGFYGQGQRWAGERFQPEGGDVRDPGTDRFNDRGRSSQTGRSRRADDSYFSSPYDSGDVGAWYGGDTGMGDSGSSQYGTPPGGGWQSSGQGRQSQQQYRSQSGQEQRFRTSGGADYGQHSGRGPRGYQRSDDRIREDVCELLTRHGEIDASEMDVDVRAGTVILRGTADSGRTRRLAEELVEELAGVHDVQNELRVRRGGSMRSDTTSDRGTSGSSAGRAPGPSTSTGWEPGANGGTGPSQHGNRWQIRETMDVVGTDGEKIGTVKAVHGTDFLLDRPMAGDLSVPASAVRTVDGERVMLSIRSSEIDAQHWPHPERSGSNEGTATR